MAGNARHRYLVNIALPSNAVDVTGGVESDVWYNSEQGRARLQVGGTVPTTMGPQGTHETFSDQANAWYFLDTPGGTGTTDPGVQNRACAYLFWPGRKCTMTGLAVRSNAGGGAGLRPLRMALYDASQTTGLPGALIADYGTSNANGAAETINGWTVNTALQPAPYWVVFVLQSATATELNFFYGSPTWIPDIAVTPSFPNPTAPLNCLYSDTGFSGAAPGTFGAVAGSTWGPAVACRITV